MTITNSTDDNNNFEIPLKLSKILEDSGIIHKLVIDTHEKYVKLRLNSTYNPPVSLDVPISIIKEKDGWTKFANKFRDLRKTFNNVSEEHKTWIYSTVNDNGSLIRSYLNNHSSTSTTNNNSNQPQQEQQQSTSDVSDVNESTENTNKKKFFEKVSVPQAIRRNSGIVAVTGTIIGVSRLFKMISKVQVYCDRCAITDEVNFNPIPVSEIKNIIENCKACGKYIKYYNIKPIEHKNAVIIELQDTNSFDELDRLSVYLFDEDTIGIKVGENVEVIGEIKILMNNNFKYLPHLYGESIQYLNRENFILTKSDIDKNKEFNETHKDKEGGVISALVSIFDASIVECEFEKKGVLMCAVNTSNKIGDESEHIDELFIGPPGLAKSKLLKRATELVPGSNRAGGQYSTGKSLTAIVEKTDDNTFLRLGSIPRSRDAICGINELAKLSQEDLDKLYDVMEEREFPFEKYGMKANIQTPTAIIASANPANKDSWLNNEKIDFNELPFLAPLKDRFDLIFIFQYKKEPKEREEFADKLAEVEAKREKGDLPNYTEFLIKYIQYAKQINPVLTDEAWFMLKEFYKNVNVKGFGSPRVLKTLKKLSKAIARLKLKNVVDEEDANETMEFYNGILVKFQNHVVYSEPPKFLAYKKGVEIVKRYANFGGITIEQIFETMCKEDKQLGTYFGYDNKKSLKIKDNHKTRDVKNLLLAHTNIKIIGEKPILLKWLDNSPSSSQNTNDASDANDKEKDTNQEKNNEKNNEKFNESGLETTSHTSHASFSKEESTKGFQMSPKGRIYKVTDKRYKELKGESEKGKT